MHYPTERIIVDYLQSLCMVFYLEKMRDIIIGLALSMEKRVEDRKIIATGNGASVT